MPVELKGNICMLTNCLKADLRLSIYGVHERQ